MKSQKPKTAKNMVQEGVVTVEMENGVDNDQLYNDNSLLQRQHADQFQCC